MKNFDGPSAAQTGEMRPAQRADELHLPSDVTARTPLFRFSPPCLVLTKSTNKSSVLYFRHA